MAAPEIHSVELVRVSQAVSLLRLKLDAPVARDEVVLVARGPGLPRRLLPLPTADGHADGRYAFALPAELRTARFALATGTAELPLGVPVERTRDDALAALELQRTRERLAELEAAQAGATAPESDPERAALLEQQLSEHRLLRSQLARELEATRERERAIAAEIEHVVAERERLASELDAVREEGTAERARLEETLDAARARVQYLERRLVEVRGRDDAADAG